MPFDAAQPDQAPAPTRVVRRWMPWRGHNAAVLAHRHAPPRLPDGWGASFGVTPARPCRVAPALPGPVAPTAPAAPSAPPREIVLAELRRLATAGLPLPRCAELGRSLGLECDAAEISHHFTALAASGQIEQIAGSRSQWRGERVVRLTDTGAVLRTAGAPNHWRLP